MLPFRVCMYIHRLLYHSRGKHTAQELGYTAIEDRRVLVLNRGMRVEQNHLDVVKI